MEGETIDRGDIKIEGDVFTHLKDEAKARMSSDADIAIKSNGEVRWDTFLNDVSVGAQVLAKLAPLGWPFAAAAVATGLTEVAFGVKKAATGDTEAERKDGAWKVFDGTLNTLFSAGASGVAKDPFELPTEELPPSGKPPVVTNEGASAEPQPGSSGSQPAPNTNVEMSDYAVQDGEQLISGVTPNDKGIYQVKGPQGEDRWLIKVSYDENTTRVFEIQSTFKQDGTTVEIIDPFTRKPVMTVSNTGDETWEAVRTRGGDKKKPGTKPIPQDDSASTSSSNQPLTNHPDWQSILDSGMYNGKPVYIHYTDKAGLEAITQQRRISDSLRNETRAGSKGGIYVNPPGQQFNGENVESLLFLGNERYAGRGNYMVIFSSDQIPQNLGPITSGSPFVEMKMPKDINLTPSNILYVGPNTFPNYFG